MGQNEIYLTFSTHPQIPISLKSNESLKRNMQMDRQTDMVSILCIYLIHFVPGTNKKH